MKLSSLVHYLFHVVNHSFLLNLTRRCWICVVIFLNMWHSVFLCNYTFIMRMTNRNKTHKHIQVYNQIFCSLISFLYHDNELTALDMNPVSYRRGLLHFKRMFTVINVKRQLNNMCKHILLKYTCSQCYNVHLIPCPSPIWKQVRYAVS